MAAETHGSQVVELQEQREAAISANYIKLRVYCNLVKEDTFFAIKRNTRIKRLLLRYCQRAALDYHTTRFVIKSQTFSHEKTPNQLGLQEDDLIRVMVDGTGA